MCLQLEKSVRCLCHGDQSEDETVHGVRVSMVSSHLGAPASPGLWWRHGGFLRSEVELHMAEIKGVAGCTVLLYFQALLLIRKQDQRQY